MNIHHICVSQKSSPHNLCMIITCRSVRMKVSIQFKPSRPIQSDCRRLGVLESAFWGYSGDPSGHESLDLKLREQSQC